MLPNALIPINQGCAEQAVPAWVKVWIALTLPFPPGKGFPKGRELICVES